jgi:exonuclease VII large subunit
MAKYYNSDYDEVVAFSEDEVNAKIAEEKAKIEADFQKQLKEKEEAIAAAVSEKEKLSEKLTKRSDEYNNLKTKFEETGQKLTSTVEEKKNTYQKLVEDTIKKASGDDKEYAETFKEKYEKFYSGDDSLTLDPSVIEERAKEIHAITTTALSRDFTPFSLGSTPSGEAPRVKQQGDERYTDTPEGKQSLDFINTVMGNAPATDPNKK